MTTATLVLFRYAKIHRINPERPGVTFCGLHESQHPAGTRPAESYERLGCRRCQRAR